MFYKLTVTHQGCTSTELFDRLQDAEEAAYYSNGITRVSKLSYDELDELRAITYATREQAEEDARCGF